MLEIKFDLGKNIVETASRSGVPKFEADDIAGSISYSVADIPPAIPARFTRQGLEISWQPLFAFTLYASRNRGIGLPVYKADLQLKSFIETDEQAQSFVEQTIAQFQHGKWKRYVDPDWNVLLTGRSSVLDVDGNIAKLSMAIDPDFKFSKEDWRSLVSNGSVWKWVGDNVVASLDVANSPGADGKPDYRLSLEFEVLDVMHKRDAENLARDNREGDAKGWGSTKRYEAGKKQRAEELKLLVQNAIKRGDRVASP